MAVVDASEADAERLARRDSDSVEVEDGGGVLEDELDVDKDCDAKRVGAAAMDAMTWVAVDAEMLSEEMNDSAVPAMLDWSRYYSFMYLLDSVKFPEGIGEGSAGFGTAEGLAVLPGPPVCTGDAPRASEEGAGMPGTAAEKG